ncbi:uncharacterized protein LOC123293338 isoform X1 [Chrysoperla carnea]|uniref:uncharacterized protein LOC123293338 isoform X1 n=1 Tax=Chrysoperla carnea TaxID=189513 RepID=UPI001D08DD56|nr:uncharacterized protein LOC123293338 isoform X1 [Chrysoperla carnea]
MLSLGMKIAKNVAFKNSQQIVRHSSAWVYRSGPKPLPKSTYFVADFVGATMWWWILWHLFTEPEHITFLKVPVGGDRFNIKIISKKIDKDETVKFNQLRTFFWSNNNQGSHT